MKKSYLLRCAGCAALVSSLYCGATRALGAIAPTDLMVFQAGDSATPAPATAGATLNILEIDPTLNLQTSPVQSFAISSQSFPLFAAAAGSVGDLALSSNGSLLSFGGWTTSGTTQANVAGRGVGTLNSSGIYTQPATYSNATTNTQVRSAYSGDGATWYFGDKSGIYISNGSGPLSVNTRAIRAFGSGTYALDASSTVTVPVIASLSPSSPSAGTTTITATGLPGLPNNNNANDFYLLSSGQNGVGVYDTLYVTDSTVGILKFALQSGSWVAEGSAALVNASGIAAVPASGGGIDLYATVDPAGSNATLVQINDSAAYNATIAGSAPGTLYTAPTGTFLRGVSPAPVAVPEPATLSVLALMAVSLMARRRPSLA